MTRTTRGLLPSTFLAAVLPLALLVSGVGALSAAFSGLDTQGDRLRALLSGGVLLAVVANSWNGIRIDEDAPTEGVLRAQVRPWQILSLVCLAVLLIAIVRRTLLPAA